MFLQDQHVVAAIDSCIHNTATVTILDSNTTDDGSMNLYMKELNRSKQERHSLLRTSNCLEQSLAPITCHQADKNQTGSWRALAASIRDLSEHMFLSYSDSGLPSKVLWVLHFQDEE
ncbi:hypothetical protein BGZ79_005110 [Entomortierella chlamydospora]|nr:hypothetical protein BGZ79_005110 [Entomortierella chlamydospora]